MIKQKNWFYINESCVKECETKGVDELGKLLIKQQLFPEHFTEEDQIKIKQILCKQNLSVVGLNKKISIEFTI